MVFGQSLNLDEAKAIGFILDPSWTSITWDNYPPLFYLIGKILLFLPFDPTLILKSFVFVTSSASFLLFARFLDRDRSFSFWVFPLLALLPAAIIYPTLTRPVILIEFFSVLNLLACEKILNDQWGRKNWLLFFGSLTGLMLSTYASVLYVVFLAFVMWNRRFFAKLDRPGKYALAIYLIASALLLFAIRWDTLSWLFLESPIYHRSWASALILRNLMTSSWISLVIFCALSLWRRSYESIFLVALISAVNFVSGVVAYEARFLIFFYPFLFLMFIRHIQAIGWKWPRNLLFALILAISIDSTWFALNMKRSGVQELQKIAKERNVESVGMPREHQAWAFLFPGQTTFELSDFFEQKDFGQKCCHSCLLFDFKNLSKLSSAKAFQRMTELDLELVDTGNAGLGSFEPFEYLEVRRQCQ